MGKKSESIKTIEAVADELERCHKLLLADENQVLNIPAGLDKGTIESKMHEMQDLLILLTKRWNGMEY
jgi:hypothetical protein